MKDITFRVTSCAETGGFVARWDDAPGRGGITTQGDSFAELDAMIADAVNEYREYARRAPNAADAKQLAERADRLERRLAAAGAPPSS